MKLLNAANTSLQTRKRMLATLIAQENIRVEFQSGISTASFDLNSRTAYLPVWKEGISNELIDLLTIHEMGHALYTPSDDYRKVIDRVAKATAMQVGLVSQMGNVLEDVRINERLKVKFPGSVRDFRIGYRHRFERGDYGSHNETTLNLSGFVDRINMFFKIGHVVNIKFTAEEQILIDEFKKLRNWDDIEPALMKLATYCKQNADMASSKLPTDIDFSQMEIDPNNSEFPDDPDLSNALKKLVSSRYSEESDDDAESNDSGDSDSDNAGDSGENGDSDGDSGEDGDAAGDSGENGDSDGDSGEDGEAGDGDASGENGDEESDGSGTGGNSDPYKGKDKSEKDGSTDMSASTVESEERSNRAMTDSETGCTVNNVVLPQLDLKGISKMSDLERYYPTLVNSANDDVYSNWFKTAKIDVSRMVTIFEMKKQAEVFKRTQMNKTGVLNTNRIHMYRTSEDVFKRNALVQEGKNHGFVFLVDTSDSMQTMMDQTKRQVVLMAMFARKIGVPFEVYTFSSDGLRNGDNIAQINYNGTLNVNRFYMAKIFDNTMKQAEFHRASYRWVTNRGTNVENSSGMTPLNSAILALYDITENFVRKNRTDIMNVVFITDGGASDDFYYGGKVFIRDPKTGANVMTERGGPETSDINKLFRERMMLMGIDKLNLINFYLEYAREELITKTENDGGYDEKYLISSKALERKGKSSAEEKAYRFFLEHFSETVSKNS